MMQRALGWCHHLCPQPFPHQVMAKILVIDDEKAIRFALKEILEYENHRVEAPEDGINGVEKA